MNELLSHRLGTVTLSPDAPIVAGSVGEWTLTYTVGSYGIDEGGTIKIAKRFASDWAHPQFEDPAAINYASLSTTGEAKLRPRYDPKAHVRPWMKCIVIDVYDGCLAPGDTVTIKLGDRSGGSPGIRAQSFIESAHEMRVLIDPTNACLVERLPSSPVVQVVSDAPTSVVVHLPTRAKLGEAVEVFVKGEDRWGNPTPRPAGLELSWEWDTSPVDGGDPTLEDDGERATVSFSTPGSGRVIASWEGQRYVSNPLSVGATPSRYGRYWADLHAQSDATVGTGTGLEYFEFGRRWAHLDVMSHQGNDFQMDDEDWRRLNEAVSNYHEDGRFVVFPGYEWSANTTAGGDRNVIYLEEDLPIMRSSHWQIPHTPEDERSPAHPASALFERLHAHVPAGKALLMAHCGGRYADIRKYHDEALEPLVEVMSCWGVFEWLLWDAFEKGYRVGVVCNSDGHKGRSGAEGPGAGQFGIFGGLTCILAESLTRAAVFEALQRKRCYGTTGPRMDLSFEVEGQPMGSELSASGSVKVRASVRGTGPVESLALYRGRERVAVAEGPSFDSAQLSASKRVRLTWGGARIRGRGRRAQWDGTIAVEGAKITDAQPFAFDSPLDGILERGEQELRFRSRTTGDLDGIDIWLDQTKGATVTLRSGVGELSAALDELDADGVELGFGGLDLRASIRRYPEQPSARAVELATELTLEPGTNALWVKATQVDGHMAWASPVYVDAPTD